MTIAEHTDIVAHGGTKGAIIETTIVLAVVLVFTWIALRERRRRSNRS